MPRVCEICGKGSQVGCNVSHSNRHTKKRSKPNLQLVKIKTPNGNKRSYVCTRCLRSGKAVKAA